jgi:hypothetical protein
MSIEPGTHGARAVEAQLGYTKTGKEQVAVQFELENGSRITWYGYFTDKTKKTTFAALRACGWVGDDLSDLSGLVSNEVEVVIEEEDDQNGKPRMRVRWVNSPGGGSIALAKPMGEAQAAAFAKKMRGSVLAHDQAEPRDTERGTMGGSVDDDDIPFS